MESTLVKSPSNDSTLIGVGELLTTLGIPFSAFGFGLQCEVKAYGTVISLAYFIPATAVFADETGGQEVFRAFKALMWGVLESGGAVPEYPLYFFIVGNRGLLNNPKNTLARSLIEMDLSAAKKECLTIAELPAWLASPFTPRLGNDRTNKRPSFKAVAGHDPYTGGRIDVNLMGVTDAFWPIEVFSSWTSTEFSGDQGARSRVLVEKVFRRVMGSSYQVVWEDGNLCIGRDQAVYPPDYASSGERIAIALAVFLSRLDGSVKPGMCLGIFGGLDGLDTLRTVGALDCLTDFMLASGASVVLQSAKEYVRSISERKFAPITKILKRVSLVEGRAY